MKKNEKGTVVDTLLYTVESATSKEKVAEELEVEDPSVERAVATLQGRPNGSTQTKKPAEQAAETKNEPTNR